MPLKAFRYETTIGPKGDVEVNVPLPPGTVVEVVVLTAEHDDLSGLVHAAVSSTDFWDNPIDDEDWNNA
jgi:hypothetical protein